MPEQEVHRGTVMVEKKEGIEEAWYADKERIPEDNLQPGMEHYYMLFNNSNEAFAMHQQMKKNQLESRISPTPRQLSICCGVTLLVKYEEIPAIKELAEKEGLTYLGFQGLNNKFDGKRHKFA